MNKQFWSKGPWDNEPNKKKFKYKGFEGFINRNDLGALCGYVEIPLNHPILKCLDIDEDGLEYEKLPLDVHGGVTFGKKATNRKSGIEYYVVGFDCAHSEDLIPFSTWMTNPDLPEEIKRNESVQKLIALEEQSKYGFLKRTYRDIDFVTKEIKSMIDQIANYKENK